MAKNYARVLTPVGLVFHLPGGKRIVLPAISVACAPQRERPNLKQVKP